MGRDELDNGEGDVGSCLVAEALNELLDPCFPESLANDEFDPPLVPSRFTKNGLSSASVGDLSGDGVDAVVVWNCTNGDEVMGEYEVMPLVKPGKELSDVVNSACFNAGEAVGLLIAATVAVAAACLLRYPWSNVLGGGLVGLEASSNIVLAA